MLMAKTNKLAKKKIDEKIRKVDGAMAQEVRH